MDVNPNDPRYKYLNGWKVNILDLRKFLASLSNDGFEEMPMGDLLVSIKSLSKVKVSPLKR